ncbi:hypothetical protein D3C80_1613240 [compost metagenome]
MRSPLAADGAGLSSAVFSGWLSGSLEGSVLSASSALPGLSSGSACVSSGRMAIAGSVACKGGEGFGSSAGGAGGGGGGCGFSCFACSAAGGLASSGFFSSGGGTRSTLMLSGSCGSAMRSGSSKRKIATTARCSNTETGTAHPFPRHLLAETCCMLSSQIEPEHFRKSGTLCFHT